MRRQYFHHKIVSAAADCSQPYPDGFWLSLRMETPEVCSQCSHSQLILLGNWGSAKCLPWPAAQWPALDCLLPSQNPRIPLMCPAVMLLWQILRMLEFIMRMWACEHEAHSSFLKKASSSSSSWACGRQSPPQHPHCSEPSPTPKPCAAPTGRAAPAALLPHLALLKSLDPSPQHFSHLSPPTRETAALQQHTDLYFLFQRNHKFDC